MLYRALIIFAAIGCLIACDEAELQPGEEGADCRIGTDPCTAGLSCTGGRCQVAPEEEPDRSLTVQFTIADRYMRADGVASTPILIEANRNIDGDAYTGELLIFPSPIEAGRMDPSIVQFIDGLAQTVYVTCRAGGTFECPEFVTLYAAFPDSPLEPFAYSNPIKLVDPTAEFVSAVPTEGCMQNSGQVAYRSDLSQSIETTESFGPAQLEYLPDEEQMILQLRNADVSFRLGANAESTSQQILNDQDVSVRSSDNIDMPEPCNDPITGEWSGELMLRKFERLNNVIESIDVSFELSCQTADGQISSIRGCFKFEDVSEM